MGGKERKRREGEEAQADRFLRSFVFLSLDRSNRTSHLQSIDESVADDVLSIPQNPSPIPRVLSMIRRAFLSPPSSLRLFLGPQASSSPSFLRDLTPLPFALPCTQSMFPTSATLFKVRSSLYRLFSLLFHTLTQLLRSPQPPTETRRIPPSTPAQPTSQLSDLEQDFVTTTTGDVSLWASIPLEGFASSNQRTKKRD